MSGYLNIKMKILQNKFQIVNVKIFKRFKFKNCDVLVTLDNNFSTFYIFGLRQACQTGGHIVCLMLPRCDLFQPNYHLKLKVIHKI